MVSEGGGEVQPVLTSHLLTVLSPDTPGVVSFRYPLVSQYKPYFLWWQDNINPTIVSIATWWLFEKIPNPKYKPTSSLQLALLFAGPPTKIG